MGFSKETETIEFKKSVAEIKEALQSISAILNKHNKGILYFGIKPNGKPQKNDISEKTLRDISQKISEKIEPKIYPHILIENVDNIDVIKVEFDGHQTPYAAEGKYYIRVADEDKLMSQYQLKQFILNNKDLRWDSLPNTKYSFNEIDSNKLKEFCNLADISYTNKNDILENNNLINNNQLLNSALILFGKTPQKYFSNTKLMCSLLASTTTSEILDQKEFNGDIFTLIKEAEKYILQNIHIGMELNGLFRNDIPEINKEAIRESVINAFLHRDYFDPDFVSIFVFRDRVEIRSPGNLFGGLTIDDIVNRNISRRRNEILADILSRAHLVERKGRGIALIMEKEPDANFAQVGGLFITTLIRASYSIPLELVEKLVNGLVENQKNIVRWMHKSSKISIKELSEKLGISTTAVDKNIQKLKDLGIIKRIGPAKDGYWKIIETKKN